MAFVIGDDCVMCGTCAANCPAEAISEGNGKYVINADSGVCKSLLHYEIVADKCRGSTACARVCPVGAISVD